MRICECFCEQFRELTEDGQNEILDALRRELFSRTTDESSLTVAAAVKAFARRGVQFSSGGMAGVGSDGAWYSVDPRTV